MTPGRGPFLFLFRVSLRRPIGCTQEEPHSFAQLILIDNTLWADPTLLDAFESAGFTALTYRLRLLFKGLHDINQFLCILRARNELVQTLKLSVRMHVN